MKVALGALLPLAACALVAQAARGQGVRDLGSISQRLQAGDASAIEELLARTRPSSGGLADANARIERLRAEVELLRARRTARPMLFPVGGPHADPGVAAADPDGNKPIDALREGRAWLRAGEPARALAAVRDSGDEALQVEARALEKLGRNAEAIEAYRRLAASTSSPSARARATADAEHLEWLAKRKAAREGRP